MTAVRSRRKPSGAGARGAQGLTPEDVKAIRDYRANRRSARYYEYLAVIDTAPASLKTTEKKNT